MIRHPGAAADRNDASGDPGPPATTAIMAAPAVLASACGAGKSASPSPSPPAASPARTGRLLRGRGAEKDNRRCQVSASSW